MIEIAAEHGEGTGDLLDEVVKRLPARREGASAETEPEEVAVAIVGRPNVGKSSLLNRLLHEERAIVSDMPGTTRDSVDALLRWHQRRFRIVDTAGIRRAGQRGAVRPARSRQRRPGAPRDREGGRRGPRASMRRQGVADQDATIAGEAEKAGCGIIIAANKWDLMKGRGPDFSKKFDDELRRQIKFLDYAPVLHISAATGERTGKVLETIDKVAEARMQPRADRRVESVSQGA